MWRTGWIFAIVALAWFQLTPAKAYTVRSGFTGGCHEDVTLRLSRFLLDDPMVDEVVIPGGDTWRKLAEPLRELSNRDLSEQQLFVLFSLIVGVRAPDTGGHSVSDLSSARQIAADPSPEVQYLHALRGREDDEPDGSQSAIAGTRESIRRSLNAASTALTRPIERQNYSAPYTLDFYNLFYVPVWEPAYLVGEAAHTLQDSFSHSIRSGDADLKKIAHVLNYIDAISTHFVESRDGLAHSRYLDGCVEDDVKPLFVAVDQATAELFDAFVRTQEGDEAAINQLFDRWLVPEEGCTVENDFCGNPKGVALARRDPTSTYLPGWMLCSARTGIPRTTWLWVIGASLLLTLALRSQKEPAARPRRE
jgi:hypothetical protein